MRYPLRTELDPIDECSLRGRIAKDVDPAGPKSLWSESRTTPDPCVSYLENILLIF